MLLLELNCEYITLLGKLPFFLESAKCSKLFVGVCSQTISKFSCFFFFLWGAFFQLPLTSYGTEPLLIRVEELEAYMTLEPPPDPRPESEILKPEVYQRILKDRAKTEKEEEKKRRKEALESQKQQEKELKQQQKERKQSSIYLGFEEGLYLISHIIMSCSDMRLICWIVVRTKIFCESSAWSSSFH